MRCLRLRGDEIERDQDQQHRDDADRGIKKGLELFLFHGIHELVSRRDARG